MTSGILQVLSYCKPDGEPRRWYSTHDIDLLVADGWKIETHGKAGNRQRSYMDAGSYMGPPRYFDMEAKEQPLEKSWQEIGKYRFEKSSGGVCRLDMETGELAVYSFRDDDDADGIPLPVEGFVVHRDRPNHKSWFDMTDEEKAACA